MNTINPFESHAATINRYLSDKYDTATADKVCNVARGEYDKLIALLPDIGGEAHPGFKWLTLAALWVAFLRPLNALAHGVEETARVFYDAFVAELEKRPREELIRQGEWLFTQQYADMMQIWSAHTKTQSTGDWVVDFVPEQADRFDHGLDFHYCPCLEFFKSQGAESLAPFFCLLDFPENRLMESGLKRTKTLAQGDDHCDFRYKRGRPVTQDWSTEVPKFKK